MPVESRRHCNEIQGKIPLWRSGTLYWPRHSSSWVVHELRRASLPQEAASVGVLTYFVILQLLMPDGGLRHGLECVDAYWSCKFDGGPATIFSRRRVSSFLPGASRNCGLSSSMRRTASLARNHPKSVIDTGMADIREIPCCYRGRVPHLTAEDHNAITD